MKTDFIRPLNQLAFLFDRKRHEVRQKRGREREGSGGEGGVSWERDQCAQCTQRERDREKESEREGPPITKSFSHGKYERTEGAGW